MRTWRTRMAYGIKTSKTNKWKQKRKEERGKDDDKPKNKCPPLWTPPYGGAKATSCRGLLHRSRTQTATPTPLFAQVSSTSIGQESSLFLSDVEILLRFTLLMPRILPSLQWRRVWWTILEGRNNLVVNKMDGRNKTNRTAIHLPLFERLPKGTDRWVMILMMLQDNH